MLGARLAEGLLDLLVGHSDRLFILDPDPASLDFHVRPSLRVRLAICGDDGDGRVLPEGVELSQKIMFWHCPYSPREKVHLHLYKRSKGQIKILYFPYFVKCAMFFWIIKNTVSR